MGEDERDDRERKDEKVGEERKKRWERMTNKMLGVLYSTGDVGITVGYGFEKKK